MTPEQLRAAAEAICKTYAAVTPDDPLDMASHKVARWALPLLDTTPIDEAWLRSVGATKHEWHADKWSFTGRDALDIGLWRVDDGWKVMLILAENASFGIVRGLTTRGDVRTLCRALGIILKGGEDE